MATPVFVNAATGTNYSGSLLGSLATSAMVLATGNLVAVVVRTGSSSVVTVTDTLGNVYTQRATDGGTLRIFSCANCVGGSAVITATFSPTSNYDSIVAMQFAGAAASSELVGFFTTTAVVTGTTIDLTYNTGSMTDAIVVGIADVFGGGSFGFAATTTVAPGIGYTEPVADHLSASFFYRILNQNSATETVRATCTASGIQKNFLVAVFKSTTASIFRVQASALVQTTGVTANITLATPPRVGDGMVVFVNNWGNGTPSVCTGVDNYGNGYFLAGTALDGAGGRASILYCPLIAATGSSFTITLTAMGGVSLWWVMKAVEVSGAGTGLGPDQLVTATGSSTTPAVGPTAALTAAETFQAAIHCITVGQSSITVGSASPAWTEEFETFSTSFEPGEADSRVNLASTGTTPSVSWTVSPNSHGWAAVLVAFAANIAPPPAGPASISQLPVEVAIASNAPITLSLSQLPLEVAVNTSASVALQLSQLPVEVAVLLDKRTYVSQEVVEILSYPVAKGRVSQAVVETLMLSDSVGRVSQVVVETLILPPSRGRVTQMVIETIQFAPEIPVGGGVTGAYMGDGGSGRCWIE